MALVALKCMQLLPNGLGGTVMISDCLHGKVRAEMVPKLGFPAWFPTVLGCYKLTQAVLNWVAGGAYTPLAQGLFAFQLGGAAFTHTIVEKKIVGIIPVLVFFSSSVIVHSLHRGGAMAWPLVFAGHAVLAAVGFATGYLVVAMGDGGRKAAGALPLSPVKWSKKRGF